MDWSLLEHLKSDLTGKHPFIDLRFTGEGRTPEGILDALVANEALMDLVKRGLVILKTGDTVTHPSRYGRIEQTVAYTFVVDRLGHVTLEHHT